MKYAMGDMVIFYQIKDLSFIDVSGIGQGMEYPVRIKGEILPVPGDNTLIFSSSRGLKAHARPGREPFLFVSVELFLYLA